MVTKVKVAVLRRANSRQEKQLLKYLNNKSTIRYVKTLKKTQSTTLRL